MRTTSVRATRAPTSRAETAQSSNYKNAKKSVDITIPASIAVVLIIALYFSQGKLLIPLALALAAIYTFSHCGKAVRILTIAALAITAISSAFQSTGML